MKKYQELVDEDKVNATKVPLLVCYVGRGEENDFGAGFDPGNRVGDLLSGFGEIFPENSNVAQNTCQMGLAPIFKLHTITQASTYS